MIQPTSDPRNGRAALITRYARRILIEKGIAEAIHFFQLDALSSMMELKLDFDLQITLVGSALYRTFTRQGLHSRCPPN